MFAFHVGHAKLRDAQRLMESNQANGKINVKL
jgi:hypothetical protein